MKIFKAGAFVAVILLALLGLGGCATKYGPETTVTGFQNISSFETKKVLLSLPVVVEKDMETKKNPDATEKEVANEVYLNLKKNLAHKGILSQERGDNVLDVQLKVHYVNRAFAEFDYFGTERLLTSSRSFGGQILVINGIIRKKDGTRIAQIDSIDNDGTMWGYQKLTDPISVELANQIEKILKDGVTVGKSP